MIVTLLAATFRTVHRSTQTKNHAALPLARLDLPHTVLQVPFSLSPLFLLVLSHNVLLFSRKEKSNKQQTLDWSDRRGGKISLERRR